MTKRLLAAASAVAFVTCILAANYVTAHYGLIPVGFGLMATAGTLLAGLTFVFRDAIQEGFGAFAVIPIIAIGAALSYFVSPVELAWASGVAFLLAELGDLFVYTPLRESGFVRASAASNVVGAVIDTFVFLVLAAPFLSKVVPGFSISSAYPGQLVGKIGIGLVVLAAVVAIRPIVRRVATA